MLTCSAEPAGQVRLRWRRFWPEAVNCEHPVDGSPCNACAFLPGYPGRKISTNVIEIDAASNNGVDNIREIREEVSYRPTEGRYKVYIIDEVHMLSAPGPSTPC